METLPFFEAIEQGKSHISVGGLWGSSKAYLIALSRQAFSRPCVVVTPSQKRAEEMYEDVTFFCQSVPGGNGHPPDPFQEQKTDIYLYSQWDLAPYEQASPHREIVSERLNVLDKLLNNENIIVIAPIEAVMHRTLPKAVLNEFTLYLGVGEEVDRQQLLASLVDTGYKHTTLVENRGEFSVRGGIVDIFPAFSGNPIRIEFFGDEIESLREFDTVTQRSLEQLDLVTILPGREIVISDTTCAAAKQNIEHVVAETGASFNALNKLLTHIEEKLFFPGVEWYAPYLHGSLETLLEYISEQTFVVFDEPDEIARTAHTVLTNVRRQHHKIVKRGRLLPEPAMLYRSFEQLKTQCAKQQQISLKLLDIPEQDAAVNTAHYEIFTKSIDWAYTVAPNERGVEDQEQHLASTSRRVREWLEENNRVVVTAYTESQARRLWEILQDHKVPARIARNGIPALPSQEPGAPQEAHRQTRAFQVRELGGEPSEASVIIGTINCGFALPDHQLIVINEDEFLGKQTIRQRHKQRKPGKFLTTLGELELNDYIVHVDHGIGVYLGLKKLTVQDIAMECLHLEYSNGDKLYVPVDRLDLVQKYKGADQKRPKLDKLGGTKWARVKERVRASVEKMAAQLLELYAARQALPGEQFTVEDHLYREFEASFEYEETPDQAQTIASVVHDMATSKPMDRLVCGDVGYGKTEVAMRAAFLTVLNGKQVAILVPTTLLAQQHFENFSERFAPYPVNVGMLSRFKTKKQQQAIVQGAKDGTIDIVIGTHRLLQKDIAFKNLGLVVIDEEQRFGVSHKEKLRQLRQQVDVLTLTATPIPRTLHMSLMGVRDLSIIETPPEGRLAIRTYVSRFDEETIYEAITRELDRGGQVFFVHNRVETIDGIALRLSRIVPHARIAIAHGQMKERELERIMLRFLHREFDVLVCTTIIESGLDIPSVNTMIINRAHNFGLAQLYQLRGRIGRSKTRGYAYLLVSNDKLLTVEAKKRLRVIQELTDVGAGFKLAAHDLEIRGAGNLLGAEQSGHIAALGFDLYCRIIEQTVREMKGQPPEEEFFPQLELQVSAHFPEEYIPDMKQRLEMYKRLMSVQGFGQLLDVEEEVRDRYGKFPPEAQNIVSLAEIKLIATPLRVAQIQAGEGVVKIVLDEKSLVPDTQLKQILKQHPKTVRPTESGRGLLVKVNRMTSTKKLDSVKNILQSLQTPETMSFAV